MLTLRNETIKGIEYGKQKNYLNGDIDFNFSVFLNRAVKLELVDDFATQFTDLLKKLLCDTTKSGISMKELGSMLLKPIEVVENHICFGNAIHQLVRDIRTLNGKIADNEVFEKSISEELTVHKELINNL